MDISVYKNVLAVIGVIFYGILSIVTCFYIFDHDVKHKLWVLFSFWYALLGWIIVLAVIK